MNPKGSPVALGKVRGRRVVRLRCGSFVIAIIVIVAIIIIIIVIIAIISVAIIIVVVSFACRLEQEKRLVVAFRKDRMEGH